MSATPPDDEQSPWSRPAVLLSGAFILALILVGVIVAVTSGGGSHKKPHRGAAAPHVHDYASRVCLEQQLRRPRLRVAPAATLPAGSQSIPSASPPAGTQWATVGSMEVPQAPADLRDPSERAERIQHMLRP